MPAAGSLIYVFNHLITFDHTTNFTSNYVKVSSMKRDAETISDHCARMKESHITHKKCSLICNHVVLCRANLCPSSIV